MTKSLEKHFPHTVASLFRVLGQPIRLQILQAIGTGEACVCHLETALGVRQAKISQHLMALRQSGVVTTRRDGRNIYYRLAKPWLIDFLRQVGRMEHAAERSLWFADENNRLIGCCCPHCTNELVDNVSTAQVRLSTRPIQDSM